MSKRTVPLESSEICHEAQCSYCGSNVPIPLLRKGRLVECAYCNESHRQDSSYGKVRGCVVWVAPLDYVVDWTIEEGEE